MNTHIQSSASWTDNLSERINHLTALLKIVHIKTEKNTEVQALTIKAIKAEINQIESKLKVRR